MARRSRGPKSSRAQGASAPTPIHSTNTTPCSSAFTSAYPSEDERDPQDCVTYIPIRRLTLVDFAPEKSKRARPPEVLTKPFRFLDLPAELRLKVYALHFAGVDPVVDLHPDNHKKVYKKLAILQTCRNVYNEASPFFYSGHTFRVFPTTPGRCFKTKRPLIARLKPHQRAAITHLELRLGPGWNKPPRGWVVNEALGLRDCVNVKKLTVFVQFDPSASFWDGFRKAEGFYEAFSRDLLSGVLAGLPRLKCVEFDAFPGIGKACPIMRNLLEVATESRKAICWGPERGWNDSDEPDSPATVPVSLLLNGPASSVLVMA